MTAAEASQGRGIISRLILPGIRSPERLPGKSRDHRTSHRSASSNRNPVQEIAPRDAAIHSKLSVVGFAHLGPLLLLLYFDWDLNSTGLYCPRACYLTINLQSCEMAHTLSVVLQSV
jgi:hypothetical protein